MARRKQESYYGSGVEVFAAAGYRSKICSTSPLQLPRLVVTAGRCTRLTAFFRTIMQKPVTRWPGTPRDAPGTAPGRPAHPSRRDAPGCGGPGTSEALRRPPGASGGVRGPPGRCDAFGTFLVLFVSVRPPGASGGLRGPPGASGPRGLGASGASGPQAFKGPPSAFAGQDVGFGSGFRVLFGLPALLLLADPEISAFPGCLGRPAQWPPSAQPETQKTKVVGFRVTNNLVNHSKGERSPRRGSCPSTWRCSSRSTNSLGLHSSYKRWCE